MAAADQSLLLAAGAMLVLRGLGLLVAGSLRPDHPLVAWAAAVSQATLAAFVALAVVAPGGGFGGALAGIPLVARLAGLAGGLLCYAMLRGGLLPALGVGLAALLTTRALLP